MQVDALLSSDPSAVRTTRRLTASDVDEAGRLLADGRLVAFPTETVYGLGADATDGLAVAAIYAAKGRPSFNPLISHAPSVADARRLGVFDDDAERLAETFWPGPLTLVLPAADGCPISDLARSGLATLALRVPAHPLARALLEAAGRPVAAPSANLSGRISPTTAAHVLADLDGRIDAVLDGGETPVGLESTIIACFDGHVRMLRPGGVAREAIEAVLGRPLDAAQDDAAQPLAPGRLASHYAPNAHIRLDAVDVRPGEALLAFGTVLPAGSDNAAAIENLSSAGDLHEAATNLFAALRRLDRTGLTVIAVAPMPTHGLGEAIRDRLERAAAPKG